MRRRALTLLEVCVVVAIVGALVAMLLPAVQAARAAAARAYCQNNLKQIGLALHGYEGVHGSFPCGVQPAYGSRWTPPAFHHQFWSWLAELLDHVEQRDAYREADAWARAVDSWPFGSQRFGGPGPANPILSRAMPSYWCPADPRESVGNNPLRTGVVGPIGFTSYLGVAGRKSGNAPGEWPANPAAPSRDGILNPPGNLSAPLRVRVADVTDGTSNTLAVGERPPSQDLNYGWWFAGAGCLPAAVQLDGVTWQSAGYLDGLMVARERSCPARVFVWDGEAARPVRCTDADGNALPRYLGLKPGRVAEPCDQLHFWSLHPGGANFLLADGSVRFLAYSIDPGDSDTSPFVALSTRNGGEP